MFTASPALDIKVKDDEQWHGSPIILYALAYTLGRHQSSEKAFCPVGKLVSLTVRPRGLCLFWALGEIGIRSGF